MALGANTDPYQPVERTLQLTRGVLEVLERFGHPVTIVTKSAGVLRDLDILRRLAARNLVHVCLSVTTLDPNLARRMEPRAATPARRVAAIGELARGRHPRRRAGGADDPRHQRRRAGAHPRHRRQPRAPRAPATCCCACRSRSPACSRRGSATHFPDRAARVLALVRETRAGALYDSRFGHRQTGTGPYADMLAQRFRAATARLNLHRANVGAQPLDCTQFAVPDAPPPGASAGASRKRSSRCFRDCGGAPAQPWPAPRSWEKNSARPRRRSA